MMNKKSAAGYACCKCKTKVERLKHLKKLNSGFFCRKCAKEKRAEHREFLKREVLGLSKEQEEQEKLDERNKYSRDRTKKKRIEREKERQKNPKINIPKIKSIIKSKGKRISSLGIYITKEEKLVLYKKLVQSGLDSKAANDRIKLLSDKMNEFKAKLKEIVKTKEELNERFKMEWGKLMERENKGVVGE